MHQKGRGYYVTIWRPGNVWEKEHVWGNDGKLPQRWEQIKKQVKEGAEMDIIQDVREYLLCKKPSMHGKKQADHLMYEVLEELANKCGSVQEFVSKAQKICINGAGIEEVAIAEEYRKTILREIQMQSRAIDPLDDEDFRLGNDYNEELDI